MQLTPRFVAACSALVMVSVPALTTAAPTPSFQNEGSLLTGSSANLESRFVPVGLYDATSDSGLKDKRALKREFKDPFYLHSEDERSLQDDLLPNETEEKRDVGHEIAQFLGDFFLNIASSKRDLASIQDNQDGGPFFIKRDKIDEASRLELQAAIRHHPKLDALLNETKGKRNVADDIGDFLAALFSGVAGSRRDLASIEADPYDNSFLGEGMPERRSFGDDVADVLASMFSAVASRKRDLASLNAQDDGNSFLVKKAKIDEATRLKIEAAVRHHPKLDALLSQTKEKRNFADDAGDVLAAILGSVASRKRDLDSIEADQEGGSFFVKRAEIDEATRLKLEAAVKHHPATIDEATRLKIAAAVRHHPKLDALLKQAKGKRNVGDDILEGLGKVIVGMGNVKRDSASNEDGQWSWSD